MATALPEHVDTVIIGRVVHGYQIAETEEQMIDIDE